ncbi:MAG: hypothetical protein GX496_03835 [Firmicutes bacterium]|nr:hypothetical protein [Bacillota bacterium]
MSAHLAPVAPLVMLSALAPSAEQATQLAHEAAALLVEEGRRRYPSRFDQARALLGTCSPPAVVR